MSSSFVFKPFYGKLAFYNRRLIHIERTAERVATLDDWLAYRPEHEG